ncbi:MAG: PAS domain S-box protein, partial [Bacteroidia bacterium]|nr:PAS domain S-box protein [Bacteroidia bacterium]
LQLENEYRSKVEANLKESQRELNSILDSTPDLIWSISVNNLQLVKWNNSFGKFIMNEMHTSVRTGMNLGDLFPNDKQQQAIWHDIYNHVLNNEAYECEFRSASGKVYLQIYSRTLKKNGVVTGVSMFAHDITLKKLAERQQQQIQLITERLVNVLIFQTTVGDDGKERFTFLSHSTEHLFGCTIDEAYSDASLVFNKIHPEDFSRISSEVRHSFSEGVPLSTISRVINSEGDTVWLSIYSRPRQSDGIRYWDGIMTDITELKKIEEELILAKEKAEESDRLKTAFLHNISHEIRTPMNSILGFSDLLDSDDTTQEQRSLYTRMISENSFILMNIVNKVIEVSSIQTGQLEVINDNVDIKELIVSVFKAIRLNLRKSSVKIQHNINISDEDNHIRSDIYKLKEILTNLMDNAVKFTKEGVVEIGCSRRGDYIEFYVQDTGIGIPEKMQGEIFNSFTQVERGDIREYGGTGLGLTISKAYVEILGGEIWLDSQEGKGSTFFFTIPIIQNQ